MIGFLLIALDALVGRSILFSRGPSAAHIYFFDTGKGDSELIIFPGNIKLMIDAGPSDAVLAGLARAMPFGDTYIDLAIVSDPESDRFGGYDSVLDHYQIGAFLYNGRDGGPGTAGWEDLAHTITGKHIPLLTLGGGDTITFAENEIDFLSPDEDFAKSAAVSDTALVELVKTPALHALLMGTAAANSENYLLGTKYDLSANILKVGHATAGNALRAAFLKAVNPKMTVTEPSGTLEAYVNEGKLEIIHGN